jgi:hypothetical protein
MRIAATSLLVCTCAALACAGCAHWGWHSSAARESGTPIPNPLHVAPMDHEYLWQLVVDTVDDYFKIAREERIRTDGGVVTDGRIHTHPETAATCLEPWRKDSATAHARLHATLQSLRRYAHVRVSPSEQGYSVEIAVYNELEDVAQPEHANVGARTLRSDGSLVRNESKGVEDPLTLGWEPLGRDFHLEQRMLAQLQGRLAEVPQLSMRLTDDRVR